MFCTQTRRISLNPSISRVAGVALALAIIGLAAVALRNGSDSPDLGGGRHGDGREVGNTIVVGPDGSDRSRGSKRRPLRTLATALRRARPGDRIVLRGGTYGRRGVMTTIERSGTAAAPITVVGAPRLRMPRIRGAVKIAGDHLRFSRLLFDGPSGPVLPRTEANPKGEQVLVAITGKDVTLSDSVIRNGAWHAGIYVDEVEQVRIVRNYIHNNGDRTEPSQANLDHGIYWAGGSGVIANNIVRRNLARGIQLYPDAEGVVVAHNTVIENGRAGIQLGDETSEILVVDNIVAFNAGSGIRSAGLSGGNNRVLNNVVWSNRDGNIGPETEGLSVEANIEADPRFRSGGDYCVSSGSPAIDRALPAYAPALDYYRNRIAGRADIGACESEPSRFAHPSRFDVAQLPGRSSGARP